MRAWVGLLLVLAIGYQLLFRYDRWASEDKAGLFYERDNLTGQVHLVKPGEHTDFLSRLLGNYEVAHKDKLGHYFDSFETDGADGLRKGSHLLKDVDEEEEPFSITRPRPDDSPVSALKPLRPESEAAHNRPPVPVEKVIATTAPPVPIAMLANESDNLEGSDNKPFAVRQVDLNRDGSNEEIIQNAAQSGSIMDISIVKNGRELFFGKGKQIKLLSTRNAEGWGDIALQNGQGVTQVFRYDPKDSTYKAYLGKR